MRCQSCNSENRETAKFCAQCGAPLELACPSCATALPAGSRFCDACGTSLTTSGASAPTAEAAAAPKSYMPAHLAREILRSRHALEGERKQVTVLFADIKGSTELIDGMDPEQAVGLTRWFRDARDGFTALDMPYWAQAAGKQLEPVKPR